MQVSWYFFILICICIHLSKHELWKPQEIVLKVQVLHRKLLKFEAKVVLKRVTTTLKFARKDTILLEDSGSVFHAEGLGT
jgi:hypothetical protein